MDLIKAQTSNLAVKSESDIISLEVVCRKLIQVLKQNNINALQNVDDIIYE